MYERKQTVMRYANVKCAVCGELFTEKDTVVVCPECGTPHHAACWDRENRCANNALHGTGFVWTFPVEAAPAEPKPAEGARQEQNGSDTVVCDACGARVYHKAMFCPQCGNPLRDHGPRPYTPETEDQNMDRILENYERYGGLDPDAELDGVACRDYSVFVGGSFPGRIMRKAAQAERLQSKLSWCFSAFLFGPFWFLYRKMVKEGVALLLIQLILTFSMLGCIMTPTMLTEIKGFFTYVEETYTDDASADYRSMMNDMQTELESAISRGLEDLSQGRVLAMQGIQILQTIVLPVLCGMFGLWFYRKKVRQDVTRLRETSPDPVTYQVRLKKTGGTSFGFALLGAAGYAAVYIVFSNMVFSLL